MSNAKNKHILIGTWQGGADDGSGLRTMIYNYGLIFQDEDKGISFFWNKEQGEIKKDEQRIDWEYLSDNKIRVKYAEEEWETIEYEISNFTGAYNSEYLKLVEKGKNSFWNSPEPLYKSIPLPVKSGFFDRIRNWKLRD